MVKKRTSAAKKWRKASGEMEVTSEQLTEGGSSESASNAAAGGAGGGGSRDGANRVKFNNNAEDTEEEDDGLVEGELEEVFVSRINLDTDGDSDQTIG